MLRDVFVWFLFFVLFSSNFCGKIMAVHTSGTSFAKRFTAFGHTAGLLHTRFQAFVVRIPSSE